jgi:hypothetical protein
MACLSVGGSVYDLYEAVQFNEHSRDICLVL